MACSLGLSPSIHSVDQIKVVDRFRGRPGFSSLVRGSTPHGIVHGMALQKSLTKDQWPISCGQIQMQRKRISQYPLGRYGRSHSRAGVCVARLHLLHCPPSASSLTCRMLILLFFLMCLIQRCWIHLWIRRRTQIPRDKQHVAHPSCTPAVHGRLFIPL